MNEVELVEWWCYYIKETWLDCPVKIYIKKFVKFKNWFKYVDWVVFSNYRPDNMDHIMTLKEFKQKVLYKII